MMMDSITLPPRPWLNSWLIQNHSTRATWDEHKLPFYHCDEKLKNCKLEEQCQCNAAEDQMRCTCQDMDIFNHFQQPERRLPVQIGHLKFKEYKEKVKGSITNGCTTTLTVKINDLWKTTIVKSKENCSIENSIANGCYSCERGAVAEVKCFSSTEETIGNVDCGNEQFAVQCSPQGSDNNITFFADKARIHRQCTVDCGGKKKENFEVSGILKYSGSIWTSIHHLLNGNTTIYNEINLPDLHHIWESYMTYMKTIFIVITIVGVIFLMTYSIITRSGLAIVKGILRITITIVLMPIKMIRLIRRQRRHAHLHTLICMLLTSPTVFNFPILSNSSFSFAHFSNFRTIPNHTKFPNTSQLNPQFSIPLNPQFSIPFNPQFSTQFFPQSPSQTSNFALSSNAPKLTDIKVQIAEMEETLRQVQTMVAHIQSLIMHTDTTMMALERKIGEDFKKLNERLDKMEEYLKTTDQDVAVMAREMAKQAQDQAAVLVVGPPALSDEMIRREPEREVIVQMEEEEMEEQFLLDKEEEEMEEQFLLDKEEEEIQLEDNEELVQSGPLHHHQENKKDSHGSLKGYKIPKKKMEPQEEEDEEEEEPKKLKSQKQLCLKCLRRHQDGEKCKSQKECHYCQQLTHHSSMCPEKLEIKWDENDGPSKGAKKRKCEDEPHNSKKSKE
ncbi:hypothetical protein CRE_06216 [Caenorhabditis remanei]|uniref:Phlebovirus glycoprotein G2 fusion domain-containing protein n=1 Tax=Caenorhabditis remanei TaxID=31234 RepID=E3NQ29_CAERE|nr:hypothetical protein CRE_06216 [Caenorhabditis remanei]